MRSVSLAPDEVGRGIEIQSSNLGSWIMRDELSGKEVDQHQPHIANKPRGVPRVDDRRVLNGKVRNTSAAMNRPLMDVPLLAV